MDKYLHGRYVYKVIYIYFLFATGNIKHAIE